MTQCSCHLFVTKSSKDAELGKCCSVLDLVEPDKTLPVSFLESSLETGGMDICWKPCSLIK